MPDGDKVHKFLKSRYIGVYKQVCEAMFSSEELAYNVLSPLIKDIKEYRNGPLILLEEVAAIFNQLPNGPLATDMIDWHAESQKIDQIARQIYGSKRGIALASEAAKDVLQSLRDSNWPQDVHKAVLTKYVVNIYEANFAGCIPLTAGHYNGAHPETVDATLAAMKPHVEEFVGVLAAQLQQRGSEAEILLRRPARPHIEFDSDADVFAIAR